MASGEPPQGRAECPITNGRSPGSRLSRNRFDRARSSSPSRRPAARRGRFVEIEASARLLVPPLQWLFRRRPFRAPPAPCRAIAPIGSPPDGRASPLYSRGVGCDEDPRFGSIPSHSLFIPVRNFRTGNHPIAEKCYGCAPAVSTTFAWQVRHRDFCHGRGITKPEDTTFD